MYVCVCVCWDVCVFACIQGKRSQRKVSQGRGRPSAAAKEAMAVTAVEEQQKKVRWKMNAPGLSV